MTANDDVSRMSKKELEREVRRLRSSAPSTDEKSAFALWLREVYHNRGFPGVTEEAYNIFAAMTRLAADNEYMKERDWEFEYHREMAAAAAAQPEKTHVAALLMTYYPDTGKIYSQLVKPHEFDGSPEDAEAQIFPQLVFAVLGIPTLSDLGNQTLDGINQYQLARIVAELFYPGQEQETLDARRKAKFEEIWELVERQYPDEHLKFALSDKFTKIVNRTRDRMLQRLGSVSLHKDNTTRGLQG